MTPRTGDRAHTGPVGNSREHDDWDRAVTPEWVAGASAAWNWYPDDATVVETVELLLVRWPGYFRVPPGLIRVVHEASPEVALDTAGEHARGWGTDEMVVWVKLDAPDGLEEACLARGGRLDETVDVFALDLHDGPPDLDVPLDLVVRWQDDEATTRDALRVGMEAFEEGSVPDDAKVAALAAEASADLHSGRGGTALAYDGEHALAAGGLSIVDGVARIWGGGVVPGARGRGAYRAVLHARLGYAADRRIRLALVKGRVETSGPILRRAGFQVHGQERSYVVPLG